MRERTSADFKAVASRRRDCHSAAPPLPLLGVSIETMRECQQNDSLADFKAVAVFAPRPAAAGPGQCLAVGETVILMAPPFYPY